MFISSQASQARWWLPCLDKIHEKYPFDIQIIIPSELSALKNAQDYPVNSTPLIAVCTGKLLARVAHPKDPKKVMYCFREESPIAASGVAIAVGPFESVRLIQSKSTVAQKNDGDGDEMFLDKVGGGATAQNSKIEIFFLPGYKRSVQTSCFYLPQAMEFFEQLVGTSYPYDSFKLVFTDHMHARYIAGVSIAITSVNLLVHERIIDQVFETRGSLCNMLAKQWFGHYIGPSEWDDIWVIVGFVGWMTYQFLKKMHGNNEDKFRTRKDMERCCLIDINQLPLCPVNLHSDLKDLPEHHGLYPEEDPCSIRSELLRLKAPLVLNMLEKRMGKNLIQKIANKVMVNTMSGEFPTGLSTLGFLKIARKISGKIEIKEFADQWIFGSGCPIFTISYHFNRKKMVIELKIKQKSSNEGVEGATPKFSGPFTVRVQEPGGTFDTEVKIEDYQQQYDIIYHTKYKRIRRKPSKKSKKNVVQEQEEEEEEVEEIEDDFGDASRQDIEPEPQEGQSTSVTAELKIAEPDRITFEWILLDPDGIWLCYKSFIQDDFMWNSILKRDKEINSQYEAITSLAKIPNLATCSTLTALVRDTSFFYRLRMEAVYALINVH